MTLLSVLTALPPTSDTDDADDPESALVSAPRSAVYPVDPSSLHLTLASTEGLVDTTTTTTTLSPISPFGTLGPISPLGALSPISPISTLSPISAISTPSPISTATTTPSPEYCDPTSCTVDTNPLSIDIDTDTPPRTRTWTGPIRAIVPLPRRAKLVAGPTGGTLPVHNVTPLQVATRPVSIWDVDSDSEGEYAGQDREGEESDEEMPARCCSYQSISAAQGLGAWSFEELRVECYAQSLVARGTKPSPVTQSSLAIPPAFIPRFVPRS